MFGSSKPTASLSSGLLARKGQARPAMRPQGFHGPAVSLDDLGWNDMGEEPAPVVSIAPAPAPIAPAVATVPPVLIEREALEEAIAPEPVAPEPVAAVVKAPAPVKAPAKRAARPVVDAASAKSKAAFTLRLDADRHLRLRLASASRNRSAQQLVIEALDAFIASLPEVEGLAAQLSTQTSGGKS
ncbi:hypothetical protein M9980_03210 [Sphingomonas donggukensis]|uniref:Uncharacterized protein n=1 Tax=Sphingomonas donggukensis TaxID=2949093 RepID=A0ABY4TYQ6_9SPHN|nr:hypothetical protein [Sphingomonas donggukensis]URW76249.1 hypothetical protein M9980_03210 [Sphingomonas donggukensis]